MTGSGLVLVGLSRLDWVFVLIIDWVDWTVLIGFGIDCLRGVSMILGEEGNDWVIGGDIMGNLD